jgi:uncharacterized protein GlcG (DUF336 family)
MGQISLEDALIIIDGALQKGAEIACDPLTVAVLDAGGHLVAFKRQDNSGIMRGEIAIGKAYGAVGFGVGGRALREKNPKFMAGVISTAPNGMVPAPGGVLIRDPETGMIIGACGISGDTGERDEIAAIAGIEAAKLVADPG